MRKILVIALVMAMLFTITGCASWDRFVKDIKSDAAGGIVKFDLNGKRYMYYNCFVEAIEEAE